MERLVSRPLEIALNGMAGLEDLRSTSIAGLTDIKCQFSYGTELQDARQDVLNRIATVDLPQGVKPGSRRGARQARSSDMSSKGPATRPISSKPSRTGCSIARLKQVPGVIDVTGYGGTVKQYQVLIDTRLLKQYGVTMARSRRRSPARMPTSEATSSPLGVSRTTSAPSGSWAAESTRSTLRTSRRLRRLRRKSSMTSATS